MKLEEHPGSITVETPEGKLCLTTEEAFELFSWLYDRRDTLYASQKEWDDATWHHALKQARLQALANGPQVFPGTSAEAQSTLNPLEESADKEPWLEDCPCGSSHLAGTSQWCPLNPNRKPLTDVLAAYRAMEAALQLLTANILNLRTELLVVKALVARDGKQGRTRET